MYKNINFHVHTEVKNLTEKTMSIPYVIETDTACLQATTTVGTHLMHLKKANIYTRPTGRVTRWSRADRLI